MARSPGDAPNRSRNRAAALVGSTALLLGACGARSSPKLRNFGEPLPADGGLGDCTADLDCGVLDLCAPIHCVAGACVASPKIVCNDDNPCTEDWCISTTGQCQFRSITHDEDGDGHNAPIPGFAPGSPGSCGDDCDDTSPLAYPGAKEVCDGVDNDCNGIVDDGARYVPSSSPAVLLSPGDTQAGLGGIAFGKQDFAVAFAADSESWANTFTTFAPTGAITLPPTAVTHVNTDTFTGPLVWTGSVFGLAWEDRRNSDFEIYFNRLDTMGRKLSPDLRVTNAPRFSLRPSMVWDGADYIVVWSDTREGDGSGLILGQRIDSDGNLIGKNIELSPQGADADGPRLAKGVTELGLVYNRKDSSGRSLEFRTISPDLTTLGTPVPVGSSGANSSDIAWSGDRYVIVWDTLIANPGPTIRGVAIAPDGTVLVPERNVTSGASYSRSEALLSLGDRLVLAWSEEGGADPSTMYHYGLLSKMIRASDLGELTPPALVASSPSDSLNPAMAFGPTAVAGIAFEDRRTGAFQVYATHLDCIAGATTE
ncbi:MAG TPA: MopE-related protein [Polyangiaceae bacterium]|nr:MopE-related protein [Polyangiaceae bacterium]